MAGKSAVEREELWRARAEAYELHAEGYTYREIGAKLGVSHVTAGDYIRKHRDNITLPELEEWRKDYVERHRILTRALMAEVQKGNGTSRAAEVLVKMDERMATMLGADAAARQEVEVTHTIAPAILGAIDQAQQNAARYVSSTRTDDVPMLDSTQYSE